MKLAASVLPSGRVGEP